MGKYKLNVARDVDQDGDEGFLLNLPRGYRFSDEIVHVRSYENMSELKAAVRSRYEIVTCDCEDCIKGARK